METPGGCLLLDAGVGIRDLAHRLGSIGRATEQVSLVLLSHEHHDHVRGLTSLTRKPGVTVAATPGTLRAVDDKLGPETQTLSLRPGKVHQLGPFQVTPIPIPHDAAEPAAFVLETAGVRLVHATDLGTLETRLVDELATADALVIESNHDLTMLTEGPYHPSLKRRVAARTGHLSNEQLAALLSAEPLARCRSVTLAHLSRTNNTPDLASETALSALSSRRGGPELRVARQDRPLPWQPVWPRGAAGSGGSKGGRQATGGGRPTQLTFPFDSDDS